MRLSYPNFFNTKSPDRLFHHITIHKELHHQRPNQQHFLPLRYILSFHVPTYDNLQVFTLLSGRVKNLLSTRYTYSAEIFQEFFGMAIPACLLALIKIKVRAPVCPVYSVLFERMKTITPQFLPLAIKRYHINILGFIAIIPCEKGT